MWSNDSCLDDLAWQGVAHKSLSGVDTVLQAPWRCLSHHLLAGPGRCFNPGELGLAASEGCWRNRDSLEGVLGEACELLTCVGQAGPQVGRPSMVLGHPFSLVRLHCCRDWYKMLRSEAVLPSLGLFYHSQQTYKGSH